MTGAGKLAAALALILATVLGVLLVGHDPWVAKHQAIGEARATTTYNLAIGAQKKEAGALLASETAKADKATKELHDSQAQREKDDAANGRTVAALAVRLRSAAAAGRLRDPNAQVAGCGGGSAGAEGAGSASAGAGAADAAQAGGLLSPELTGLLFEQAQAADAINLAYTSCRPDAMSIREALK